MKKIIMNNNEEEIVKYVAEQLAKFNPADMEFDEFVKICYAIRSYGMTQELWETWANQDATNPRNNRCAEIWDSFNPEENYITFEDIAAQIKAKSDAEATLPASKKLFKTSVKTRKLEFLPPSEIFEKIPVINDFLIEGVLRPSKKLLLVAPPKAGKTFFGLNLCLGVASGTDILGFKCKQGEVLYVDCETGLRDVAERLYLVAEQRGISKEICDKIKFYDPNADFREKASDLLFELAEQIEYGKFNLIVIDSFYCVFDGDENSAKDVGAFMRQVDYLIHKTGAAVLIIHHEGKNGNVRKNIIERACGSNVFARFPDGIIGLSPNGKSKILGGIREKVEMVLRAFPSKEPFYVIFKDGLHFREEETTTEMSKNKPAKKKTRKELRWERYSDAFEALKNQENMVSVESLAEALGVERGNIYNDISGGIPGFVLADRGFIKRTEVPEQN